MPNGNRRADSISFGRSRSDRRTSCIGRVRRRPCTYRDACFADKADGNGHGERNSNLHAFSEEHQRPYDHPSPNFLDAGAQGEAEEELFPGISGYAGENTWGRSRERRHSRRRSRSGLRERRLLFSATEVRISTRRRAIDSVLVDSVKHEQQVLHRLRDLGQVFRYGLDAPGKGVNDRFPHDAGDASA